MLWPGEDYYAFERSWLLISVLNEVFETLSTHSDAG